MNNMNTKRNKKIHYSVFKTMDMGVLTTQTMAAADKDVEWLKVHNTHTTHNSSCIHSHLIVSGWLTDSASLLDSVHSFDDYLFFISPIDQCTQTYRYTTKYTTKYTTNWFLSLNACSISQFLLDLSVSYSPHKTRKRHHTTL